MHLGCSIGFGKEAIKNWIWMHYVSQSKILDIGAGEGTYANLLGTDNYIMDAIEIYEPAVSVIITKYRTVYNMNALDFPFWENYDLVIMGDVLEHFTPDEARQLINKMKPHCKQILIAVPFMFPQAAKPDNAYEEHKQPDLSFEVMSQRYPEFQLLLLVENKEWEDGQGNPYTLRYAYYTAKGDLNE